MKKYMDNVYMATIPTDHDMCIFSDNGGSQTFNQTIPGADYIYRNGAWEKYDEAEVTPTQPSTDGDSTKILVGDVNFDGIVSVADATVVQRCAAELTTFNAKEKLAGDCNGDKIISVADATLIQKYAAEFNEDLKLTGTYVNA